MKIINNHIYSKESFSTYKFRVILKITTLDDVEHNLDIYTTCTDKNVILNDMIGIASENVKGIIIYHTATKEQDDRASELIEETLKDW